MPTPKLRFGSVDSFEDVSHNFALLKKELLYVLRNLDEDNFDRFHRGAATFANPLLTHPNVTIDGYYGKTSSTTPVRFNAITFVHTGVFLTCHVYAKVESSGATCKVQLVDEDYNVLAETSFSGTSEKRLTITAPIGQPSLDVKAVYILFSTSNGSIPAYIRSTVAYLE